MSTLNGLPMHILLVHAVVVLLPLSALLLVLTAFHPAARRRLAGPNAVLAAVVLVLVPLTAEAGEWLERRVPDSDLLHQHTELGDTALLYAVPLTVLAVVVWWRHRQDLAAAAGTPRQRVFLAPRSAAVTRTVAAVAVVVAAAGVYGMYRIGDSGAKAVWTGEFSSTATGGDGPQHD